MQIESIHKWIHEQGIVNEKGEPILFHDYMFMFDPFRDFSPRQVYKACSQVGKSVKMLLKAFHVMRAAKHNVIYTLPTDSDVKEFVPTKVDKIIRANISLSSALDADNVFRKGLFGRDLHFKGTRGESAAVMTTADLLIHDEVDRSDQPTLEDFRSRIKRSAYAGIWEISNPSFKNTGIDVSWKRSDRKEWAVRCAECRMEQILEWSKNVDYRKKIYACRDCGAELTDNVRRLGRWVAANPGSTVSGYHISQMLAPWLSAAQLIQEEEETDDEYFSNFVLGEPIGEGDAEDFRQIILDAWTPKDLEQGPFFMGVDIGSTKHYVIGNERGIFKIGKLRERIELESLIEHYNPTVVMDAGPERTWAEEFRRKYPKLTINFYKRDKDKKVMLKWGEEKEAGIVWSDRSRVIDATVTALVYTDIELALEAADLEAYTKHWLVMTKKKEIDSLGLARFVWDKNSEHAQDHWVHATVYYWIARSRGKPAVYSPSPSGPKLPIIHQTSDGSNMRDLEEYLEEKRR